MLRNAVEPSQNCIHPPKKPFVSKCGSCQYATSQQSWQVRYKPFGSTLDGGVLAGGHASASKVRPSEWLGKLQQSLSSFNKEKELVPPPMVAVTDMLKRTELCRLWKDAKSKLLSLTTREVATVPMGARKGSPKTNLLPTMRYLLKDQNPSVETMVRVLDMAVVCTDRTVMTGIDQKEWLVERKRERTVPVNDMNDELYAAIAAFVEDCLKPKTPNNHDWQNHMDNDGDAVVQEGDSQEMEQENTNRSMALSMSGRGTHNSPATGTVEMADWDERSSRGQPHTLEASLSTRKRPQQESIGDGHSDTDSDDAQSDSIGQAPGAATTESTPKRSIHKRRRRTLTPTLPGISETLDFSAPLHASLQHSTITPPLTATATTATAMTTTALAAVTPSPRPTVSRGPVTLAAGRHESRLDVQHHNDYTDSSNNTFRPIYHEMSPLGRLKPTGTTISDAVEQKGNAIGLSNKSIAVNVATAAGPAPQGNPTFATNTAAGMTIPESPESVRKGSVENIQSPGQEESLPALEGTKSNENDEETETKDENEEEQQKETNVVEKALEKEDEKPMSVSNKATKTNTLEGATYSNDLEGAATTTEVAKAETTGTATALEGKRALTSDDPSGTTTRIESVQEATTDDHDDNGHDDHNENDNSLLLAGPFDHDDDRDDSKLETLLDGPQPSGTILVQSFPDVPSPCKSRIPVGDKLSEDLSNDIDQYDSPLFKGPKSPVVEPTRIVMMMAATAPTEPSLEPVLVTQESSATETTDESSPPAAAETNDQATTVSAVNAAAAATTTPPEVNSEHPCPDETECAVEPEYHEMSKPVVIEEESAYEFDPEPELTPADEPRNDVGTDSFGFSAMDLWNGDDSDNDNDGNNDGHDDDTKDDNSANDETEMDNDTTGDHGETSLGNDTMIDNGTKNDKDVQDDNDDNDVKGDKDTKDENDSDRLDNVDNDTNDDNDIKDDNDDTMIDTDVKGNATASDEKGGDHVDKVKNDTILETETTIGNDENDVVDVDSDDDDDKSFQSIDDESFQSMDDSSCGSWSIFGETNDSVSEVCTIDTEELQDYGIEAPPVLETVVFDRDGIRNILRRALKGAIRGADAPVDSPTYKPPVRKPVQVRRKAIRKTTPKVAPDQCKGPPKREQRQLRQRSAAQKEPSVYIEFDENDLEPEEEGDAGDKIGETTTQSSVSSFEDDVPLSSLRHSPKRSSTHRRNYDETSDMEEDEDDEDDQDDDDDNDEEATLGSTDAANQGEADSVGSNQDSMSSDKSDVKPVKRSRIVDVPHWENLSHNTVVSDYVYAGFPVLEFGTNLQSSLDAVDKELCRPESQQDMDDQEYEDENRMYARSFKDRRRQEDAESTARKREIEAAIRLANRQKGDKRKKLAIVKKAEVDITWPIVWEGENDEEFHAETKMEVNEEEKTDGGGNARMETDPDVATTGTLAGAPSKMVPSPFVRPSTVKDFWVETDIDDEVEAQPRNKARYRAPKRGGRRRGRQSNKQRTMLSEMRHTLVFIDRYNDDYFE